LVLVHITSRNSCYLWMPKTQKLGRYLKYSGPQKSWPLPSCISYGRMTFATHCTLWRVHWWINSQSHKQICGKKWGYKKLTWCCAGWFGAWRGRADYQRCLIRLRHELLANFADLQLKTAPVGEDVWMLRLRGNHQVRPSMPAPASPSCTDLHAGLKLTWNSEVACEVGNSPFSLNNCMTRVRLCSNIFLWPFSASRPPGVFGVPGEVPSTLSTVSCPNKNHKQYLYI